MRRRNSAALAYAAGLPVVSRNRTHVSLEGVNCGFDLQPFGNTEGRSNQDVSVGQGNGALRCGSPTRARPRPPSWGRVLVLGDGLGDDHADGSRNSTPAIQRNAAHMLVNAEVAPLIRW